MYVKRARFCPLPPRPATPTQRFVDPLHGSAEAATYIRRQRVDRRLYVGVLRWSPAPLWRHPGTSVPDRSTGTPPSEPFDGPLHRPLHGGPGPTSGTRRPRGAPPDRGQQHDRRVRKDALRLPSAANRRRSEGTSWPIRHVTERILQPNRPRPTMAKFLSRARSWMWPLQAVLKMKDSPATSLSLGSPGSAICWGITGIVGRSRISTGTRPPRPGPENCPCARRQGLGTGTTHPCPTWRRPDNASSALPGGGTRRPPPIAVPLLARRQSQPG